MTNIRWSPEKENLLRKLVSAPERWSAEEISKRIDVSRNAVIGKIHRLKLDWQGSGRHRPQTKKSTIAPVIPGRKEDRIKPPVQKFILDCPFSDRAIDLKPVTTPKPPRSPTTLLEASNGQCRWIIGNPRELTCCGKPASENPNGEKRPYCEEHSREAYKRVAWSKPVAAEMPSVERLS